MGSTTNIFISMSNTFQVPAPRRGSKREPPESMNLFISTVHLPVPQHELVSKTLCLNKSEDPMVSHVCYGFLLIGFF